ncbi:MAG TPA: thioredoxin fold domain-containing protein [Chthoniobacterales bacterium]|nr:thioredoxin fold domain-containing protein [Chthoniobacterales bacterium]
MRNLRALIVVAGLFAISCSKSTTAQEATKGSGSTKSGWLTNFAQAQEEAKAGQKLLLMDFTGSDWCGWCIMLDKEIFSKPEFKEYASKNLVLLELDFPKRKELPAETQAQNERLAMQYRIQGFPTVVVLDSNGKTVGALGYVRGGPEAFIAELEKLRKG